VKCVVELFITLREKIRFLRHPHHKKHKLRSKRRCCAHWPQKTRRIRSGPAYLTKISIYFCRKLISVFTHFFGESCGKPGKGRKARMSWTGVGRSKQY